MMRPCLDCGQLSDTTRCSEHRADTKPTARNRGYDTAWDRLSARARKLQPFCTDCGATTDLQTDHTPEAWARAARGLPLRLTDVAVVCGPCNRRRGAARGQTPRGNTPPPATQGPQGEAKFGSLTGGVR